MAVCVVRWWSVADGPQVSRSYHELMQIVRGIPDTVGREVTYARHSIVIVYASGYRHLRTTVLTVSK